MQITLEIEISDSVINQESGECAAFVKENLAEEVLCYVINELDMSLDSIIRNMIKEKEDLSRGITV